LDRADCGGVGTTKKGVALASETIDLANKIKHNVLGIIRWQRGRKTQAATPIVISEISQFILSRTPIVQTLSAQLSGLFSVPLIPLKELLQRKFYA